MSEEIKEGDWLMFRTNDRLKKGIVTDVGENLIFVGTKEDDPAPIPITRSEVERLVSEKDDKFTHTVTCTKEGCNLAAQTKHAREAHKIALAHNDTCTGTPLMRHFPSSEEASEAFVEARDA